MNRQVDPIMVRVEADLDRFFAALARAATVARDTGKEVAFAEFFRAVKDRKPDDVIKAIDEWATKEAA